MRGFGAKQRIAIIDDDISFREALTGLVRSLGYDPDSFSSAADFMEQASTGDYVCLLVDVQMPGMTGIELLKRLLRNGDLFRAGMISSITDDSVKEEALAHGAACFLVKPFSSDDLVLALEAVIER